MFRIIYLGVALTAITVTTVAGAAHAGSGVGDRIEDRRDLRESVIDEAYDHGPLDVIEDHLDRAEGRRDRRDNKARALDRAEDRRDLRESVIDEAYDRGPLDVIEDKIDRAEGRRDRLNRKF